MTPLGFKVEESRFVYDEAASWDADASIPHAERRNSKQVWKLDLQQKWIEQDMDVSENNGTPQIIH